MFAHIVYNTVTQEIIKQNNYINLKELVTSFCTHNKLLIIKDIYSGLKQHNYQYIINNEIGNGIVDLDRFSYDGELRSGIIPILRNIQKNYFRTKTIKQIIQ